MASFPKPHGVGLTCTLAFVGGFGDAAGFVLAKTFTGHITGNLVLAAVSVAALDWPTTLIRLSAVAFFLAGILLSVAFARFATSRKWPPLVAPFATELTLITAGSLILRYHAPASIEIFVLCSSLALGLQNGAFRRAGGVSVHTTYITGLVTGLLIAETERLLSEPTSVSAPRDESTHLLYGIWFSFFVGAATGATLVLHFKEAGMLVMVLTLCVLIVRGGHS
jgi:uncharacterized membrane protein YoaK (UPF0700 family)